MDGGYGLRCGAFIEGNRPMRLALAAGITAGGIAFSALALEMPRIDADQDGWVTRAEAAALAERVFVGLDTNDDNKLDDADRAHDQMFEFQIEDGAASGARIERRVERRTEGDDDAHAERHVIIRRGDGSEESFDLPAGEHAEGEHIERRVIIRRDDGSEESFDLPAPPPGAPHAPHAAIAPLPPGPPLFMMLIANSEESDVNGDGALSLEEFRAQHLRFFDASDANGDGRIHFTPPELSEPPEAPRPPR